MTTELSLDLRVFLQFGLDILFGILKHFPHIDTCWTSYEYECEGEVSKVYLLRGDLLTTGNIGNLLILNPQNLYLQGCQYLCKT